jgi:hypothetical protein
LCSGGKSKAVRCYVLENNDNDECDDNKERCWRKTDFRPMITKATEKASKK